MGARRRRQACWSVVTPSRVASVAARSFLARAALQHWQHADLAYKCEVFSVPKVTKMSFAPRFDSSNLGVAVCTRTERTLPAGVTRVAERLRGSPRTRSRQPRGAIRMGALTTDLP